MVTSDTHEDGKKGIKPKKPGNTCREGVERPTEVEREERIQFAIGVRLKGGHRKEMEREIASEFGITMKTASDYLVHAKTAILEKMDKTTSELTAEAYSRLVRTASDMSITASERTRAEAEIIKLFGLAKPHRHAITDTKGNDLEPDEARTRLSVLASSLAQRSGSDRPS